MNHFAEEFGDYVHQMYGSTVGQKIPGVIYRPVCLFGDDLAPAQNRDNNARRYEVDQWRTATNNIEQSVDTYWIPPDSGR
jgi:hypothetical protein